MTNPEFQPATENHPEGENGTTPKELEILPRLVREKLGLSVAEMAELIGMSEFGYRNWEAGSRRPGGPALKLLALLDAQPKQVLDLLKAL
ncbi:hypothetical protein NBRC116590_03150 [Pelagimonas sp. KU-00592-HH]|uniref:helix-turn-helix domain-containing protein n=1 Tax=Pelagimonas sp. KU-00592-HH TaxID=3127651 RepID=UPI0031063F6B